MLNLQSLTEAKLAVFTYSREIIPCNRLNRLYTHHEASCGLGYQSPPVAIQEASSSMTTLPQRCCHPSPVARNLLAVCPWKYNPLHPRCPPFLSSLSKAVKTQTTSTSMALSSTQYRCHLCRTLGQSIIRNVTPPYLINHHSKLPFHYVHWHTSR